MIGRLKACTLYLQKLHKYFSVTTAITSQIPAFVCVTPTSQIKTTQTPQNIKLLQFFFLKLLQIQNRQRYRQLPIPSEILLGE